MNELGGSKSMRGLDNLISEAPIAMKGSKGTLAPRLSDCALLQMPEVTHRPAALNLWGTNETGAQNLLNIVRANIAGDRGSRGYYTARAALEDGVV
jgi:hypothetical protein